MTIALSLLNPRPTLVALMAVVLSLVNACGGGGAASEAAPEVAPVTITAQPVATSAVSGASASFSVTATGTSVVYQWQSSPDGSTWTNVGGATSATLVLTAVSSADNGKRFRVAISNAQGTVNSAAAQLTVSALVSSLAGRAWVAGQSLETNDNDVLGFDARIDDAGAVTVVFIKSDGTRPVLYATRGTPQPAGVAPRFSAPIALDASAPSNYPAGRYTMGVAPGGNAVAAWTNVAPCTASSYNTSGSCYYSYVARYLSATSAWEAPVQVGSNPAIEIKAVAINDRGDVMVDQLGWNRSASGQLVIVPAMTWRSAAQGVFRQQTYATVPLANVNSAMDNSGNLLVVAQASQNATTDIVAFRGNVTDGLGAQEVLDTRISPATLLRAVVGVNGQALVMWGQNDGTSYAGTVASLDVPTGAWSSAALPAALNSVVTDGTATLTDSGDAIFYSGYFRLRRIGGVWSPIEDFTAFRYSESFSSAINRDGSKLVVSVSGPWSTFDAPTDRLVNAFTTQASGPGYVYGVARPVGGLALLSRSGIGALIMKNSYDVLPSPAVPMGEGRSVVNLWGLYFK